MLNAEQFEEIEAIGESLILPPLILFSDVLVRLKHVPPVVGISICVIEIRYPGFHLDQKGCAF
jgi:hypothetical protein